MEQFACVSTPSVFAQTKPEFTQTGFWCFSDSFISTSFLHLHLLLGEKVNLAANVIQMGDLAF